MAVLVGSLFSFIMAMTLVAFLFVTFLFVAFLFLGRGTFVDGRDVIAILVNTKAAWIS